MATFTEPLVVFAPATKIPSAATDSTPAKAKRIADTLRTLSYGQFLPLFTDKVRNNVRSRAVLIATYAVSAAFVTLLIIFAVSFGGQTTQTGKFSVPPPKTVRIGEPWDTFAFQVKDSDGKGVAGLFIYLYLMPVHEVALTVTYNQGTMTSRSISCLPATVMTASTTAADDMLFCNPTANKQLMLRPVALTDKRGIATFTNVTLTFGIASDYFLSAGVSGANSALSATQILSVQSITHSIDIVQGFTKNRGVSYIPVLDTTSDASLAQSIATNGEAITAQVAFVPSLEFQARYYTGYAQAAAAQAAAYFGRTIDDSLTALAEELVEEELGRLEPRICGAIISLDPQRPLGSVSAIVEPLDGPMRKGVAFVNNIACNSTVVPGPLTASGQVFYATLTWTGFGVTGTNTPQVFLGISAMGMTVPLPVLQLETTAQSPREIIVSAAPSTMVAAVSATVAGPMVSGRVVEGQNLGTITVLVLNNASQPLPRRTVYLYDEANPDMNPAVKGTGATTTPHISGKSLVNEVAITNSDGVATFLDVMFTVRGATGWYDIYVIVDGVSGLWQGTSSGNYTLHVGTSVAQATTVALKNASAVEYFGENWTQLPVVTVTDALGVPLPGKVPILEAADRIAFPSFSLALPVNDEGTAFFVRMAVYATNSSSTQCVQFNVVIDNVVVATLWRWIALRMPASNQSTCAYVHVLSAPPVAYFGTNPLLSLKAVDVLGRPVANASVVLAVPAEFFPPPPGEAAYTEFVTTGMDGTITVPCYFSVKVSVFGFIVVALCQSANPAPNYASVVFVSRVTKVEVRNIDYDRVCVGLTFRNSSLATVNSTFPVTLSCGASWFPSYVVSFFPESYLPESSPVLVTDPRQGDNVCISLSQERVDRFPFGMYAWLIAVDRNSVPPVLGPAVIAPPEVKLELIQSLFSSLEDASVVVGQVFANEPMVYVTSNGLPVAGMAVFAQYGYVDASLRRVYVNVFESITSITQGVFDSTNSDMEHKVITVTNESGYAQFSGMILAGGPTSRMFSVRYCVYAEALNLSSAYVLDLSALPNVTNCVEDVNVGVLSPSQSISFAADVTSVGGTPGGFLPPIVITATKNDGGPVAALLCAPRLVGAVTSYLTFPAQTLRTEMYGTFFSNSGQLTLSNVLTMSPATPAGTYTMVCYCSGGQTNPVTITVSAAPSLMSLAVGAPTTDAVSLSTIIPKNA